MLKFCSQFDFEVVHMPGKKNVVDVTLSQFSDLVATVVGADDQQGTTGLLQHICDAQQRATGDEWNAIMEKAHAGNGRFIMRDGLVYCTLHNKEVALVVPDDCQVLFMCYSSEVHVVLVLC